MSKYQFTPQALGDLLDIWSTIARENPRAANRVEAAILQRVIFSASRLSQAELGRSDVITCSLLGCVAVLQLFDRVRCR